METSTTSINLHDSWKSRLAPEFEKGYMKDLKSFLQSRYRSGATIYPPGKEYFSALDLTHFEDVKVVILGQDPYHGPNQAHGLCFSVKPGVQPPPSLLNMFKEIEDDLGFPAPNHGCLTKWAGQGVLLLNSVLTVERGRAGAHQGKGWELFTDQVIKILSESREGLVFMLWGSYAQRKGQVIDSSRHLVLKSPHPSPLSAYRGFFGCGHFSKANAYLEKNGQNPVDWSLPANTN